jgi:NPCBM/NEW2 domain
MPRLAYLCLLAVLCGALATSAAEPAAAPPPFILHRADGSDITGPLKNLGDDWSVGLGGATPSLAEGNNVITLRRKDTPLPAPPSEAHVILANGDRLTGVAKDLTGERLTFRSNLAGNPDLAVQLSAVAVLWLADPAGVEDTSMLRRRLLAEPRKRDVVSLRNGDVVEGTVTGLDKDGFHVDAQGKQATVERAKVAYVAFSTLLLRSLTPKGAYGHLVLADGSRLGIVAPQANSKSLTAKTLFGAEIKLPIDDIVALDIRQGRAVYLSDLKPSSYTSTPYGSISWPYVLDGAVEQQGSRDLALQGSTYDKGLGLHSGCRISYALSGSYRHFEALAGLDARSGGSARLQVLVDGKPRDLGWAKDLTTKDAPLAIRLDVTGAKELTLIVEGGGGGYAQGRVNLANARLIRDRR